MSEPQIRPEAADAGVVIGSRTSRARSPEERGPQWASASGARRLGVYRVEGFLGHGGMGEVFLAWDERLKRFVAIKRIRTDKPLDSHRRARFRREARAVARLSHPAIVQIYDIFESDDGDCIVMEYLEGASLDKLIGGDDIDLPHALEIGAEIADGLGEAHAKGLVHRDLKAANVIVTTSGHAKILDFGLARALWHDDDLGGETAAATASSLTQAGSLVGTAHAMSPEQAVGQPVDHRSDLFALGILLYEMVTGQPPFCGDTVLGILRRVATQAPRPIAELRPGIPASLVDLLEGLLAKNPARRPQNARLVAAEMKRIAALSSTAIELAPVDVEAPDAERVSDLPTAEMKAGELAPYVDENVAGAVTRPVEPEHPRPPHRAVATILVAGAVLVALTLGLAGAVLAALVLGLAYLLWQEQNARRDAELRTQQTEELIDLLFEGISGKLDPDDPERSERIAAAHRRRGDDLMRRARPEQALVHYRNEIEILRQLMALSPDNPDWQSALSTATENAERAARASR